MPPLVIGSRGSQLALWQARHISGCLLKQGVANRIEIIRTTGDHLQTASLAQAGGKGLFTKEIEEALLAGTIDLAVHSLKDLPTEIPSGLVLAAIPERESPFDAIVGSRIADLPMGARLGTSSGRRAAQARLLRPDLDIQPIRGNVDTRLRKQKNGDFNAILLAAAGLLRLGLESEAAEIFSADSMCPAPGQGALAVQTRCDDEAYRVCRLLNHEESNQAVLCERTILSALGGGCQLPVGAFARLLPDTTIQAMAIVLAPDGSKALRGFGNGNDAQKVGLAIARDLLARGASELLQTTMIPGVI